MLYFVWLYHQRLVALFIRLNTTKQYFGRYTYYVFFQDIQLSTRTAKLHYAVRAQSYKIDAIFRGHLRRVRVPVFEARQAKVSFPVLQDFAVDTYRYLSVVSHDHSGVLRARIQFMVERHLHVRVPNDICRHRFRIHNYMRHKWTFQR